MFAQVVLGALVRHGPTPLTQRLHFLAAFVATALAVWMIFALFRDPDGRARVAFVVGALCVLITLQLILGVEAWMAKFGTYTPPDLVQITSWSAAIRTAHALFGTLVLATTVGLTIRLWQPESYAVDKSDEIHHERVKPLVTATRESIVSSRFGGDST
jgi:heme A synthase